MVRRGLCKFLRGRTHRCAPTMFTHFSGYSPPVLVQWEIEGLGEGKGVVATQTLRGESSAHTSTSLAIRNISISYMPSVNAIHYFDTIKNAPQIFRIRTAIALTNAPTFTSFQFNVTRRARSWTNASNAAQTLGSLREAIRPYSFWARVKIKTVNESLLFGVFCLRSVAVRACKWDWVLTRWR